MDVPTVTVVTPTYEEAANLLRHVEAVLAQGPGYRIVIVDDASPDGTGRLADELANSRSGRVDVIHRSGKSGLASAYVAGIRLALLHGSAMIGLMDADGSHDPADLPLLVEAAKVADVVLGSRYCQGGSMPGWPLRRRLLSKLGGRYATTLLGLSLTDPTSGFRVMKRSAAAAIDLDSITSAGFGFNLELTWQLGRSNWRIAEAPIAFRDRQAGKSKLSAAIAFEAAILVWRLRLRGPAPGFDRNDRSDRSPNSS